MLIIEKGRSRTAPADTARVNVLRNSLEEESQCHQWLEKAETAEVIQKEQNQTLQVFKSKKN